MASQIRPVPMASMIPATSASNGHCRRAPVQVMMPSIRATTRGTTSSISTRSSTGTSGKGPWVCSISGCSGGRKLAKRAEHEQGEHAESKDRPRRDLADPQDERHTEPVQEGDEQPDGASAQGDERAEEEHEGQPHSRLLDQYQDEVDGDDDGGAGGKGREALVPRWKLLVRGVSAAHPCPTVA